MRKIILIILALLLMWYFVDKLIDVSEDRPTLWPNHSEIPSDTSSMDML